MKESNAVIFSQRASNFPNSFDGLWILNRLRNPAMAELRTANELYVPWFRLKFSARLPLHIFPKVWNEFNNTQLKNIQNVKTFKEKLNHYFLDDLAPIVRCNRPFCRDCFPVAQE